MASCRFFAQAIRLPLDNLAARSKPSAALRRRPTKARARVIQHSSICKSAEKYRNRCWRMPKPSPIIASTVIKLGFRRRRPARPRRAVVVMAVSRRCPGAPAFINNHNAAGPAAAVPSRSPSVPTSFFRLQNPEHVDGLMRANSRSGPTAAIRTARAPSAAAPVPPTKNVWNEKAEI